METRTEGAKQAIQDRIIGAGEVSPIVVERLQIAFNKLEADIKTAFYS